MRAFSPFRSSTPSQSHPLLPLHHSPRGNQTPKSTTSVLLPPPLSHSSSLHGATGLDADTLVALSRQTTHIQATLQSLLDAQSAGLLAGLASEAPAPSPPSQIRGKRKAPYRDVETHSNSDGRSRIPTTRESSTSRTSANGYSYASSKSPSRDAPTHRYHDGPKSIQSSALSQLQSGSSQKKPISLRTARAAILRSLYSLAAVKEQESAILSSQLSGQTETVADIDAAEVKKQGIQHTISTIENDPHSGRPTVEALEHEQQEIETEITAMEERLMQLKARLRKVTEERAGAENKLEAGLSSWRAALGEVERAAGERWLDRPPLQAPYSSVMGSAISQGKGKGVFALPRERRTLGMVKEELETLKEKVISRKEEVDREKEACILGTGVWKEVINTVNEVETKLSQEVNKLAPSPSPEPRSSNTTDSHSAPAGMDTILSLMSSAISRLSTHFSLAESQNWKLLVCCIGAELEALREGKELLESTLVRSTMLESTGGVTVKAGMESTLIGELGGDERLEKGWDGADTAEGRVAELQERSGEREEDEDEDDEPGPELLISHLED